MSDNEDYNIEDSDVDKKEDEEDDKTIDDVLSGDEISDDDEASNNVNEDSENDMEDDDDIYESNEEDVSDDDSDSDNDNDNEGDPLYGGGKSKKSAPRKKKVSEEAGEPDGSFKNIEAYSDDEDDDDDEDDENYLQKFDREVNRNYILEQHPECVNHNYDEIVALAKVVRDKDNNIVDPLHRTIPFLTKFEKARILGQRAKQIESGARPFVEVPDKIIEGNVIALLELQQKRLPFIIRRPLPSGGSEYWHLSDLDMIDF